MAAFSSRVNVILKVKKKIQKYKNGFYVGIYYLIVDRFIPN